MSYTIHRPIVDQLLNRNTRRSGGGEQVIDRYRQRQAGVLPPPVKRKRKPQIDRPSRPKSNP